MNVHDDSSNSQGFTFLQGASNINMPGATVVGTQNNSATTVHNTTVLGTGNPLNLLYSKVSHNAILNAGGRADDVRCYPGTREEVLSKLKQWRDQLSEPFLWLSGPAGAGKTAIVQTFAEQCIALGVLVANFFFFRSDSTRNHSTPIVATLMFQLMKLYPNAKQYITATLSDMPYMFDQAIREQFTHLLINPINALRAIHNDTRPIVLLIDGLDECGTALKEAQGAQATLLQILDDLVATPRSPFKVLVGSRQEAHLTMAFNKTQSAIHSIFLDNQYQPAKDIRRYVSAQFSDIKKNHHLGYTLDNHWPSPTVLDQIVEKSSSQFIYAATVVRFVSSSPASPAHSVDLIRGIRTAKRGSPFAELDAIYAHILSQADDWDSVKTILSTRIVPYRTRCTLTLAIQPLEYTKQDIATHTASLVALMKFHDYKLTFYHASLVDFLTDQTRSGTFFLEIPIFTAHLASAHFSRKVHTDKYCLRVTLWIAAEVTVSSPSLENALAAFSPQDLEFDFMEWHDDCRYFLAMLNALYGDSNERFYKALLKKWLPFFHKNNYTKEKLLIENYKFGPELWAELTEESSKKRHKIARLMKGLLKKS